MFSVVDFIAGWNAGICGILIGHPADTIRVRQQIMNNCGIKNIIQLTYKHEGIRGFYKGMAFPITAAGVLNSLFFGISGNSLRVIEKYSDKHKTKEKERHTWDWNIFASGCIAGLAQTVVACPVEVIKINLQSKTGSPEVWKSQHECKYTGVIGCLKGLYKEFGWKGFYRGYHCMIYRDVVSSGVYVAVYAAIVPTNPQERTISNIMFAGGLAGMISWMVIMPIDVMKSRIQADNPEKPMYKNTMDCFIKSYLQDGIKVFSRGFLMTCLRAFPVNGATFLGLETTVHVYHRFKSWVSKHHSSVSSVEGDNV